MHSGCSIRTSSPKWSAAPRINPSARAQSLREHIQGMATSDDVPEKARLLQEANDAVEDVRRIGHAVVSAFFDRDKPKERQALRVTCAADVERWGDRNR